MRRQPILLRIAIASLAVGAYALVRNLLSTWQTIQDYPNAQFLPVFLSTESATGGTDIMFVFYVWGPLVFGGLGIALLVAHFVTRAAGAAVVGGAAAATAQAWAQPQQPQQGGWQPQQTEQGWQQQQQPAPQQQGWQPEPQQQAWQQPAPQAQQQPNPIQPLGGTQPPPPNAADRIQP
ncbi:hypothetical protein [Agrococcus jejuensis]|uniref:Uncharacterized protein n=1 Tax=Agrococcus jejuensis TaxID=399736 RepID=A0A1G8B4Y5_9MICO|nr:hypothetical protein [Agrococcus jejuensis]SDH28063.1 hypothetical protein SAMN04489720_0656 [Agrococcus jejuensis]